MSEAKLRLEMGHWLASGVSVRGRSHFATGEPCQDHCIARSFGGVQILALADGAGSCELSGIGAKAACIGFVSHVRELLGPCRSEAEAVEAFLEESTETDWHAAVESAREWVERAALKREVDAQNSMACTFLGAVLGSSSAIVLQIGDGAWVAEVGQGCFGCVTWPENGEFGNETFFLTQATWREHVQFAKIPKSHGLRSLTGFSDGVETLCLDQAAKVPIDGFFQRLATVRRSCGRREYEAALKQLLQSPRVTEKSDDDCSIVAVCREGL
jgi:hypothetical protein